MRALGEWSGTPILGVMPESQSGETASYDGVPSADIEQQVRRWLEAAATAPVERGAEELAMLLKDPRGLEFATGFVDRVLRADDPRVAARAFERLSRRVPQVLPWYLRSGVVAGGGFGIVAPRPIIPAARALFRRLVGHLVVDARPPRLGKAIAALRRPGIQLDLDLLTGAVLGSRAADRRLADLSALLDRPEVDRVTFRLASVTAPRADWAFDETVEHHVERLTPLFDKAARSRTRAHITLDVTEYRDLDLTLAVFTRLLAQPDLARLDAGIVLPACYPDSLPALTRLTAWARERLAAGGAGITVRITPDGDIPRERVEAAVHGRPLAAWSTRAETDAHALRMLSFALQPAHTDAVRIGVAAHDPFLLASALLLARERGVASRVAVEMRLGVAPALAEAVRADVGGVLLRVPVADPTSFDAAIPYLVRRFEEGASPDDILSVLPDLDDDDVFAREAARFQAVLQALPDAVPATHRTQDRARSEVPRAPETFRNTPDTDPATPGNRAWARALLSRAADSRLGVDTAAAARVADEQVARERLRAAAAAGADWGREAGSRRAEALDRAGEVLEAFRGRLIETLVAETGATFAEADIEVSHVVDAAHYYAARARELAGLAGAEFEPVAVTVVTATTPRAVSVAADGTLAALAAGSAVLLLPPSHALRSAAVLVDALAEAGLPHELVALIDADDEVRHALVTAPEVRRVLAETVGTASIIVTPSADLERAVADLVASAFAHAGQGCVRTSHAILVGSVGDSARFRTLLADAVSSLAVGSPLDPQTQVGPLHAPATGEVARALTQLADGETWLVKPRPQDATDRLWSPGVRDGVRPGGEYPRSAAAPVLGLVAVPTLAVALDLQNASDGLAAGIHSLDAREVDTWLAAARAGTLYVNRPTTGQIVRRQPFGGWGPTAAASGAKTGGPNTLLALGDWRPDDGEPSENLTLDGLDERVRTVIEAFQPVLDYPAFDMVRRAAFLDEKTWATEFGRSHDPSALGVERHVLRYRPADVVVRCDASGTPGDLARVICAGVRARAKLLISTATPLPSGLLPFVDDGTALGRSLLNILGVTVESDVAFRVRAAKGLPARIRLVGSDVDSLAAALDGAPETVVWAGPVTTAGRIEMLPFLREQTVSITAHRFGTPDKDFQALDLGG